MMDKAQRWLIQTHTEKAPINDAFPDYSDKAARPVNKFLLCFVFELLSAYCGFIHQTALSDGKYSYATIVISVC